MKKHRKNNKKNNDEKFVAFGPSNYDPDGAYTGVPEDFNRPIQDADDL